MSCRWNGFDVGGSRWFHRVDQGNYGTFARPRTGAILESSTRELVLALLRQYRIRKQVSLESIRSIMIFTVGLANVVYPVSL